MCYLKILFSFSIVKLVYEELLDRAKEKEEKEAKKRQRLADEFTKLLYTFKVSNDSFSNQRVWKKILLLSFISTFCRILLLLQRGRIASHFLKRHKSTGIFTISST